MQNIFDYIRRYFSGVNKWVLFCITLLTAFLVFMNYAWDLDGYIRRKSSVAIKLLCWWLVLLVAFGIPYLLTRILAAKSINYTSTFLLLIIIAPLLFACKMSIPFYFSLVDHPGMNYYWNYIIHWPVLAVLMFVILYFVWKLTSNSQTFYGLTGKNVNWTPYLVMLLCMIPLITFASFQPDFLETYPKINRLSRAAFIPELSVWQKILFELSYGSDFFTIELFFRGFLILGFMKWAGKDAILPMACFYCTIHFGKPLGECISSYFGGILLGIVVFETRSILGGLLVHLGIAWLMEVGGYLGNTIAQ